MGLSTIIGRPDKSAGSGLNATMRSTFDRLRARDFRVKGQDERTYGVHSLSMDRLQSVIQLSDAIVEKTAYISRQAQERRLVPPAEQCVRY